MTDRSVAARIAALEKWARTDARDGTAAARAAFRDRWDRIVDPECKLPVEERTRRARAALRAHMQRLALASAKGRRLR